MAQRIEADLLGELLAQHGAALALYAAQWTEGAEDCVQEALIELATHKNVPENIVAWLYRVVKHRALNASRGSRRRRERETESWRRRLVRWPHGAVSPGDSSVLLLDALEQLPAEGQELVIMRIWGGLSFAEIAAAMGVSLSTAQRRYEQSLSELRQLWSEPCPSPIQPK